MRLARGTGPEGIGGIPEVNGYIMRPLLNITRNDDPLRKAPRDYVCDGPF